MSSPPPSFRLDGRVALITGASSGIGATLARGFAAAGAHVMLAARRLDRTETLAAQITALGQRASAVTLDVNDRASIHAAFEHASQLAAAPDIVINNAGIAEPAMFLKTDDASLQRIMQTNFFGAWNVCQEMARRLSAAQRPGSIINIASVLGLGVAPGYAAYSASKGALIQMTRALAIEFVRHRIRVNAIAPGWFISEMNAEYFASEAGLAYIKRLPPGRTGDMQELLGPALLLASEAGSYVNGVVLPVDGGHHAALV
jgi:NAD(P)-dependent dehydrogenase (short-subunit alcohol dehydrogenase family)